MINALEKVVYPNGKTQSLAEIGGAVEGLSALIDEVDRNTSAIGAINQQLAGLVDDWQVYHEFEQQSLKAHGQTNFEFKTPLNADFFVDKKIKVKIYAYNSTGERYASLSEFEVDGNNIKEFFSDESNPSFGLFSGTLLPSSDYSTVMQASLIVVLGGSNPYIGIRIVSSVTGGEPVKATIYISNPPTRTAKKKAIAKRKEK